MLLENNRIGRERMRKTDTVKFIISIKKLKKNTNLFVQKHRSKSKGGFPRSLILQISSHGRRSPTPHTGSTHFILIIYQLENDNSSPRTGPAHCSLYIDSCAATNTSVLPRTILLA